MSGSRKSETGGKLQGEWSWDDYIVVKGSTIRVELSGAELGDADLSELARHLDAFLRRYSERHEGRYALNIDLSCNLYISDDGIAEHLAPFLERWPLCHRLKLYRTSIGDGALRALSGWAAGGHAHELHFSDLGGLVTGDGVFHFLSEVHRGGRYPYRSSDGVRCPLWLRLEHNAVPNTERLVHRAQAQGMSVSVLQKVDLGQVRPGAAGSAGAAKEATAVNLVLFHRQELRVSRQWLGSIVPMAPVPAELRESVRSCAGSVDPSGESRLLEPSFWEQFLGPSQRGGGKRGGRGPVASEARAGEEAAAELRRALGTLSACPASGDEEVLARWRCHLRSARSPEREARRILCMTAKLCDEGYLEPSTSDSSQTLSSPPALSDAASSGSSSDPVALDTSTQPPGKPEGEGVTDEAADPLAIVPPSPPLVCALIAAPCA